jgi:hypothetical protein
MFYGLFSFFMRVFVSLRIRNKEQNEGDERIKKPKPV